MARLRSITVTYNSDLASFPGLCGREEKEGMETRLSDYTLTGFALDEGGGSSDVGICEV